MLLIREECSYLFIEQAVSYNGSYAPKIQFFSSEFNDSILLFDIVILILHISNALLISVTLYSCFRWIDRRMCVIDYIHCRQHGWLPVIWVTNQLAWEIECRTLANEWHCNYILCFFYCVQGSAGRLYAASIFQRLILHLLNVYTWTEL